MAAVTIHTMNLSDVEPDAQGNVSIAVQGNADPTTAFRVMTAPVRENGRTEWFWLRLANGDLFLACAPRGRLYESLENEPGTGWGL